MIELFPNERARTLSELKQKKKLAAELREIATREDASATEIYIHISWKNI